MRASLIHGATLSRGREVATRRRKNSLPRASQAVFFTWLFFTFLSN